MRGTRVDLDRVSRWKIHSAAEFVRNEEISGINQANHRGWNVMLATRKLLFVNSDLFILFRIFFVSANLEF